MSAGVEAEPTVSIVPVSIERGIPLAKPDEERIVMSGSQKHVNRLVAASCHYRPDRLRRRIPMPLATPGTSAQPEFTATPVILIAMPTPLAASDLDVAEQRIIDVYRRVSQAVVNITTQTFSVPTSFTGSIRRRAWSASFGTRRVISSPTIM